MGFKKVIVSFLTKQFSEIPNNSARFGERVNKTSRSKKVYIRIEENPTAAPTKNRVSKSE